MASSNVASARDAAHIGALLDSPEIAGLIADLQETRWTGRPGYPLRAMVGLALIKNVYALKTWTRAVLASLCEVRPEMGQTVAIDGSDLPAYANGHKHVGNKNGPLRTRFADPDAGWGHRSSISTRKGGAFYGYKLHLAICTRTELPLAWTVRAANEPEQAEVPGLLDTVLRRGSAPGVAVMDCDGQGVRRPADARRVRVTGHPAGHRLHQTAAGKAGKHKPPACEHGEWLFAGSDAKRGASKWRCPSGECQPASVWVKASRPHSTDRWKAL